MKDKCLDILFVLVLYKTKLERSLTYNALKRSLAATEFGIDMLVYDNSPANDGGDIVNDPKIKVNYIIDKANGGVSKAYNTGAELAVKMNKKWMMLLDQDTNFPAETITKYLEAIEKYPGEKLFAPMMMVNKQTIVSPCHFKFMRGFSVSSVTPGINSLKEYSVINCGICIDTVAFNANNGYNELIRLDFSDHDFIRRFRKVVGDRFIVIDLKVNHELSTTSKTSLDADLVRFDYYLEGAKYFSSSFSDSLFLNINALLRSLKLSRAHGSFVFLKHFFNQSNGKNG